VGVRVGVGLGVGVGVNVGVKVKVGVAEGARICGTLSPGVGVGAGAGKNRWHALKYNKATNDKNILTINDRAFFITFPIVASFVIMLIYLPEQLWTIRIQLPAWNLTVKRIILPVCCA
jgi:hypothetical protein